MRTWSDLTGKFKTDATLLEFKSQYGTVRLRKTDGRVVEVPVAKLSTVDRDYLNKLEPGKKVAEGVTAGPASQPANAVKPAEAKTASDAKSIQVHLVPRVPLPSVVNWSPIIEIALGDKPPVPLKAEPAYRSKKPQYGVLRLGDAEDNQVCVVVDCPEREAPRIYVDRNNDRDLTNDGDYVSHRALTIDARYTSGVKPYALSLGCSSGHLFVHRQCGMEGEVTFADGKYKILVLNETCDGRFDNLKTDAMLVDASEGGNFRLYPAASTKTCSDPIRLNQPFKLGDVTLQASSMSADGTLLTLYLAKSPLPATAHELASGEGASRFSGKGLEGEPIDLAAEKGNWKYVLLHFWRSNDKCLEQFAEMRRVAARFKNDGLRIIGVNLDENRETAVRSVRAAGLQYPQFFDRAGQKSPVAAQYNAICPPRILPPGVAPPVGWSGMPDAWSYLPKGVILSRNLSVVDTTCLEAPGQLEARLETLLGPGDKAAADAVERAAVARGGQWTRPMHPGELRTDLDGLEVVGVVEIPDDSMFPNRATTVYAGVAIHRNHVYVLGKNNRIAVFAMNRTPPPEYKLVAECEGADEKLPGNIGIHVVGDTLLCDRAGAIEVFSLADPSHPKHMQSVPIPKRVFTACLVTGSNLGVVTEVGYLSFLDLSDASTPKFLGSIQSAPHWRGCVVGKHFYTAESKRRGLPIPPYPGSAPRPTENRPPERDGIAIFDLSEPAKPREAAFLTMANPPGLLVSAGNDRLVLMMGGTAQLMSLADPLKPEPVGRAVKIEDPSSATGVVIPVGEKRVLLTAGDVFEIEENGLVPRGKFGIGGRVYPAHYSSDSHGPCAAVRVNQNVILFRGRPAK
jgi:peroxiredoxin